VGKATICKKNIVSTNRMKNKYFACFDPNFIII
jgi:hypothetical protein